MKKVLGPNTFVNWKALRGHQLGSCATQKVLTAEIAKNAKIDVIVSGFLTVTGSGALPQFTKQGKSIPALPRLTETSRLLLAGKPCRQS